MRLTRNTISHDILLGCTKLSLFITQQGHSGDASVSLTYLVHDSALHSLLLLEHLDPLLQPPLVEQQCGPWVCFVLGRLPLGPRLTLPKTWCLWSGRGNGSLRSTLACYVIQPICRSHYYLRITMLTNSLITDVRYHAGLLNWWLLLFERVIS